MHIESFENAPELEVLAHAALLQGRTLAEIASSALRPIASLPRVLETRRPSKGFYGEIVEAWFGIENNKRSAPDFIAAGIELKTIPLEVRPRAGIRVKERTYVTLINYEALARETWPQASVLGKLNRILFVYYWWQPRAPIEKMTVALVQLWSPTRQNLVEFKTDWGKVQRKAADGRADTISAADGLALAAATKGRNRLTYRTQSGTEVRAKQRGWVLKEPFTLRIYEDAIGGVPRVESLAESLNLTDPLAFESAALAHFSPYVGRQIGGIAAEMGIDARGGYHYVARVVRRALGLRNPDLGIAEFHRYGIEVKTVRVSPVAMPYQHLSFPAFDYYALLEEEWDDSDLLQDIDRLLIVPVVGETDKTPYDDSFVGRPFFWSPDASQIDLAQREWELFRREISEGKANALTPPSQTKMVHVRPHTRRAANRIPAPGGPATIKSFWLNRRFIRDLVIASGLDWDGKQRR